MVTMPGTPWLTRIACVAFFLLAGPTARAGDYADLVAAERAFAADAKARSVRDAFLTALAEDGVVFAPGPVSGHQVWNSRPVDGSRLEWAPAAAEISASGDLGYTYGPWRFTPAGADQPTRFGHYFTVWQKQVDGSWKALVDKGVAHDEMPVPTEVVRRGRMMLSVGTAPTDPRPPMVELRQADLLPPGQISPDIAASDVVAFRNGTLPRPVSDASAFRLDPPQRSVAVAVIAAAGDLAVTWGGGPRGGSWLRVWRRAESGDPTGQTWRLAADVSDDLQIDVAAPGSAPPKVAAPVVAPPVIESPKVEVPPVAPPIVDAPEPVAAPLATPPVDAPKIDAPKLEVPKPAPAPVVTPKVDAPRPASPPVVTPPVDASKPAPAPVPTPKIDAPRAAAPAIATPPAAAPKVEAPKPAAAPVIAPKIETPKDTPAATAAPKPEAPKAGAPADSTPKDEAEKDEATKDE